MIAPTSWLKTKTALLMLLSVVLFAAFGQERAQALTVSPVRIELAGDPGTTITGEFLLINEQANQQLFYLSSENFEARGEEGTPTFVASKEGLSSWVKTAPSVRLLSGEKKKVQFKIDIPVSADPGGHFAAIFAGTSDPAAAAQGGQVSVGAKIGVLVLLRVNGEVAEGGGLLSFEGSGRVVSGLPLTFSYRFQNTGGDRLRPTGDILLTNTFGMTAARILANPSEGNILPASTRKFTTEWLTTNTAEDDYQDMKTALAKDETVGFWSAVQRQWSHFALGLYTARLTISYGVSEVKEAAATYRFLVFPWQLLTVIGLGVAVVGFGGRAAIRRYNRWIIAQANRA
jgi:hypothetical protein